MRQLNNTLITNKIIFDRYMIYYNDMKVFDILKNRYIHINKKHRVSLINDKGKRIQRGYKVIYRMCYNKEYCRDMIKSYKDEVWKSVSIDNTNRYFISNYARVKSYCGYEAVILKGELNSKGYERVNINGKKVLTHKLVMKTFSYNLIKPYGYEIDHIDDDKTNNKLSNLQYLTKEENINKMLRRNKKRENHR